MTNDAAVSPTAPRVLVTGGSRGIGRGVALAFAAAGSEVLITGRSAPALAAVAAEAHGLSGTIETLVVDGAAGPTLTAALTPWARQGVDVVVANAGISRRTPPDGPDSVDADWDALLQTNLSGVWYALRAAAPYLHAGGRVILMSSDLGRMGAAGYAGYAASKHGLLGLMQALSPELASREITVNAVCPGWVQTNMADESLAEIAAELGLPVTEVVQAEQDAMPLGRFLSVAEVTELVLYLAGPHASAITGQVLGIDAGTTPFA